MTRYFVGEHFSSCVLDRDIRPNSERRDHFDDGTIAQARNRRPNYIHSCCISSSFGLKVISKSQRYKLMYNAPNGLII